MRGFTTIVASAALLACSVMATPYKGRNGGNGRWNGNHDCLTTDTAALLVNGFGSLLSNYSTSVAESILADNFTDTSDSINSLAGYPLGGATFPSKQAFEAGQGSQQAIGFELLAIDAVGCDSFAFRWIAHVGGSLAVKGINVGYAIYTGMGANGWQIESMYSEFNSIAWVTDIGGTVTLPGAAQ